MHNTYQNILVCELLIPFSIEKLFYVKAQLTENNITTFPINDLFVLKSSKSTYFFLFLLKSLFGIFEFQIPHKTLY